MFTYQNILKEIHNLPPEGLEELYHIVHSLNQKNRKSVRMRNKILSFAGAFNDMTDKNYSDYVNETKRTRKKLFGRSKGL